MTVEITYGLFIRHGIAERLYAKETIKKQEDVFRCWILPAFHGREVESINKKDILYLRERMIQKSLSINRQYSILMTIKLWLKLCRRVLELTCLDPMEITLPRRKLPVVQFLTNEEVQRIRDTIRTYTSSGMRLRVLIEVLLATGLRISEALALDREFIDRGQREIEIRGKGDKRRVIFFTEEALNWVRRMLANRRDSFPALFVTSGDYPRRLARADISRFFIRLRKDAGITKQLTPHLLRHTYCTNLLANGADIMHIKELAGHSDIQITARYYLGVDREALRKIVKRLNYKPEEQTMLDPPSVNAMLTASTKHA